MWNSYSVISTIEVFEKNKDGSFAKASRILKHSVEKCHISGPVPQQNYGSKVIFENDEWKIANKDEQDHYKDLVEKSEYMDLDRVTRIVKHTHKDPFCIYFQK